MMHLEITMVPFTWRDRSSSYPQSSATQSDGSIDGKRVELFISDSNSSNYYCYFFRFSRLFISLTEHRNEYTFYPYIPSRIIKDNIM